MPLFSRYKTAVARGVDAVEIYTSHYMGESQGIYVRPDESDLDYTGIVTPYDLRGRTVGVPFGSTTHYQLLFLIELLNLEGTVTVVNMSPKGTRFLFCERDHQKFCTIMRSVAGLRGIFSVRCLSYYPRRLRTNPFDDTLAEIMDAWDAAEIDAGAVWGTARDYILEGGEGETRPANTLLSSGVISE